MGYWEGSLVLFLGVSEGVCGEISLILVVWVKETFFCLAGGTHHNGCLEQVHERVVILFSDLQHMPGTETFGFVSRSPHCSSTLLGLQPAEGSSLDFHNCHMYLYKFLTPGWPWTQRYPCLCPQACAMTFQLTSHFYMSSASSLFSENIRPAQKSILLLGGPFANVFF